MSVRVLGGRYELHTPLGRGGMATVWRGIDIRLDRPVAIKVLEGFSWTEMSMLQRLEREARTVARLAHPNIVAVYDIGVDEAVPYLVMELVDGSNLWAKLEEGPLDLPQVVEIATQLCDALDAAHAAGVVHLDIKPDNIMLTAAGTAKVCDFGIARLQQAAGSSATKQSATVGTSEYMAPEQATNGPVDGRTDLYALGCLLYTMLTGDPPFGGDNPVQVLRQHLHDPPQPVTLHRPGIPAELDVLVGHLLAKNPTDRPATAGQVRTALMRLSELPALSERPLSERPALSVLPASSAAGSIGGPATAATADSGLTEDTGAVAALAAAGRGRGGAHARAAVVPRTQVIPAFDVSDEPLARRVRIGPLGIAAVATGTALVTVLAIVLFLGSPSPSASRSTLPSAPSAAATGSTSPSVTAVPSTSTIGALSAVRAAIQAQVQAGNLDLGEANDLTSRLNDIERLLAAGETDSAADKVEDLRRRISALRKEHKLTQGGYRALDRAVDELADILQG